MIDQKTLNVVSEQFFIYVVHAIFPDYSDLAEELFRLNTEGQGKIVVITSVEEPFSFIYQTRALATLRHLERETSRMGIQMSEIKCDATTCTNGNSECYYSSFAAVGVAGCEDNKNCPSFVTSKWSGRTQDAIKLQVHLEIDRCIGVKHDETCDVKCKRGFKKSNSLARCKEGTWTDMPTCEPEKCTSAKLSEEPNFDFSVTGQCSDTSVGESCALKCRDGFAMFKNGDMKNVLENKRKYSSYLGNNKYWAQSTIDSGRCWAPSTHKTEFNNDDEWAELDLETEQYVRGVVVSSV